MVDLRNFIYHSDYPVDYIVKSLKRDYIVEVGDFGTMKTDTIPHGLPFAPLVDGVWGLNPDLSDSRSIINDHYPRLTGQSIIDISVSSDENNIYITCFNNDFTPKHFYFKLWCYPDPGYDGDVEPVEDSTNFSFNSMYDYLKLFMTGSFEINPGQEKVIYHNLGYKPRALVWGRNVSGDKFRMIEYEVTDNFIKIKNNRYSRSEYKYRIYGND